MEWQEYREKTSKKTPHALLKRAVKLQKKRAYALDLGAGGLRDTRYLLSKGFRVIAVDMVDNKLLKGMKYVQVPFHEYEFPKNKFNFVNFHYSLPFTRKGTFSDVWKRLEKSVRPGGIIVGQFFGVKDSWYNRFSAITFHKERTIRRFLSEFEILHFKEIEGIAPDIEENLKYWHVYNVIAKKL